MYHSVIVEIDGVFYNTWDDWHLIPSSVPAVAPPPERTSSVTVPGRNGEWDTSHNLTGGPVFDNRTGKWEFYTSNDHGAWYEEYDRVVNLLQGKRVKLALEDDPLHYYEGSLQVYQYKPDKGHSKLTLEYNLKPDRKEYPVTELTLNQTSVKMAVGMSFVLTVMVTPGNTFYRTVNVTVAPRGIIDIGADGRITAIQNGVAAITVKCGAKTAICTVEVGDFATYTITQSLENCSASNTDTVVLEQSSYRSTIAITTEDTEFRSVIIRMGGVNITASAWTAASDGLSGTVNIETVTGNVEIIVTTASVPYYNITYDFVGDVAGALTDGSPLPSRVRKDRLVEMDLCDTDTSKVILKMECSVGGADITETACAWENSTHAHFTFTATGDAVIHVTTGAVPSLNDCPWGLIKALRRDGKAADCFKAGDVKTITIKGTVSGSAVSTTLDAVILGIGHNAAVEGEGLIHFGIGKSGTKLTALGPGWAMNDTAVITGGWAASKMRKTTLGNDGTPNAPLAGSVMAALPDDLRRVLSPVVKYTYNDGAVSATSDYLWLLTEYEVRGTRSYAYSAEVSYQKRYDYFTAGNSMALATDAGAAAFWTMRSPYPTSGTSYVRIYTNTSSVTSASYAKASEAGYQLIGFCV